MKIEALREFVEFAKCQNITVAARRLYLSQPALSNHIAGIEKELGVELVHRGHTLELTAAGKAFFEGACSVIDAYDATVHHVEELGRPGASETLLIRSSFGAGAGHLRLMELLDEFSRAYPAVTVRLIKNAKQPLRDDLDSGASDCAQVYNYAPQSPDETARYECLVLASEPITVAARSDHPLMQKESVSFEDLLDYPYAMPAGDAFEELHSSVLKMYRDHGHELRNVHYKAADSLEDLVSFQTQGSEILLLGNESALPPAMAARHFSPPVQHEACLVFRRDNPNPALASFTAFLRKRL